MAVSKVSLAFAAAALFAPAVATAATATYTFNGDVVLCGVNAPEGTCATPGSPYDLTFTRSDGSAPTLSATGAGTDGGSTLEGINHFDIGLGVGDSAGNASSRIGQLEDIVLTFGSQVTIESFEVDAFRRGDQQGQLFVNPIVSEFFDFNRSETIDPENVISGTVFTWTNITPSVEPTDGVGYFLSSVTVSFEDPEIIPVPPALPLLGGAIGLLIWRARKAKTSA